MRLRDTAQGLLLLNLLGKRVVMLLLYAKVIQNGDCSILLAECLTIREAIMVAVKKKLHRIIIDSDSQLVMNTSHGKISARRDIVSIVEDIRNICFTLKEVSIGYCTRECNGVADRVAKSARKHLLYRICTGCCLIKVSFFCFFFLTYNTYFAIHSF